MHVCIDTTWLLQKIYVVMDIIDNDENLEDDLVGDYNVISRPQELIELQKQSSSAKPSSWSELIEKSSSFSKRSADRKHSSKSKEKRSIIKHDRKGLSKSKHPYKSPLNEGSPKKYAAEELDNKFESFVQKAKSSIYKKTESTKMPGNESEVPKNKSSDQDNSKVLDIQPSKIMTEPAITPLQRFQVLDARDAALRARESKESSKKVKILGSCPDMCPEKERYCRIAKNCLSVLEIKTALDQNTTSRDAEHCYMVKEYSRSSADQQEPLPHELRPISVLIFTMDYLICNIMDMPLDNISLADWYDFIWNRTRSIRKDITQQEICNIQAVEIIEKCVRFHIHCAEALSEEDTATFDPKINNENLTKCLQTLKHMYHDLQSKGIQSPNEAEFRSYDILLSLTEGETLRLIKDIRKDLQKSPLIKSAFGASLAFKSHNYVKFFKIIEKADYLSSCILHRYIIEARVHALQIIVRAYTTHQNASMYPITNLVKDLKFENAAEACEFCKCHGLEADETFVTIERRQFSRSASGLPASRSYLLVGNKRVKSLGEIINHGQMPPNPLHSYQPHNSFDEKNMLKIHSLGSVTKEDEKTVNVDFTMDEQMETDEDTLLPQDVSSITTSISGKTTSTKLKDANMQDLEKARSMLLEKLSKLQYLNTEKLKQKQSELLKSSHKTKDKKTTDSPSELSVPVTSLAENSDSSVQETDNFKHGRNISLSTNDFFKPPVQTDSSFFKHSSSVESLKPISPMHFAESQQEYISSQSGTVPSIQVNKTAPANTSGIQSLSFEFPKNFSFQIDPFAKVVTPNVSSEIPVNDPPKSPNKEYILPTQQFTFGESILHRTEDSLSSSEKSSVHSGDKTEFATAMTQNEGIEIQEITEEFQVSSNDSAEVLQEVDKIIEEKQENDLDVFAELVANDLYSECLEECSISICEEVLNDERAKKAELENELEVIRANLARKVILTWKHFTERKRQRRMFQNCTFFSPWQPMLFNTPYISSGAHNPVKGYNKINSLSKQTVEKILKRNQVAPGWEEFEAEEVWPLRAFKPHPSAYLGSKIKYFFKLCIVFPANWDNSDAAIIMDWICAKFSLQRDENFKLHYFNTFILHNGKAFVSVQAIQLGSEMSSSYEKFLDGITAMILFVPQSYEFTNSFFEDFTSLLDSDTLQYPYPLFAYFMESQESTSILSFLHDKLDSRYFTDIKTECLYNIKNFTENSEKILEALRWLIHIEAKHFPHPWLNESSFRNYIEDSFVFAFNILLCKRSLDEFKCLKQMPQHIINFYNKVLKFRASILCSELLERIHASWPPEEMKQHLYKKFIDIKTQKECKEKMEHLLLPNFEGEAMNINHIWNFVKCVSSLNCVDKDMLFIRIDSALQHVDSSFDWLNIINICALHLIHAQNCELSLFPEDVSVYYTQDDLETFEHDDFWLEVISYIRSNSNLKNTKRKNESKSESPVKKKKWDYTAKDTTDIQQVKEKNFISNPFDMPDILNSQRTNMFASLKEAIAKQMEQSEDFSNKLNKSLRIGTITAEELDEEDSFLSEVNTSVSKATTATVNDSNLLEFSFNSALSSSAQESSDWLDATVNKSKKGNSLCSITDKISELKYNIEKNSILEDHYSHLLHKLL